MKNKNKKITGVVKDQPVLEEKVTAEVQQKDPENAKEIIKENIKGKRKGRDISINNKNSG